MVCPDRMPFCGGVDPSGHGPRPAPEPAGGADGPERMRLPSVDAGGERLGWVDDEVAAKIARIGRLANHGRPRRAP
jgi:hypothetical protein